MIKKAFIFTTIFLTLSNVYAQEDCVYDQKNQREYYQELCRKYKNCKYIESECKAIIQRDGELIELKRGGCHHFGVSVTLITSIGKGYDEPKVLLNKALDLADEFWHDHVTAHDLRELIEKKKYQFGKTDTGYYYLFSHKYVAELLAEYSFSNGSHKIEISYYTNV